MYSMDIEGVLNSHAGFQWSSHAGNKAALQREETTLDCDMFLL
jgi:hypothetical protein